MTGGVLAWRVTREGAAPHAEQLHRPARLRVERPPVVDARGQPTVTIQRRPLLLEHPSHAARHARAVLREGARVEEVQQLEKLEHEGLDGGGGPVVRACMGRERPCELHGSLGGVRRICHNIGRGRVKLEAYDAITARSVTAVLAFSSSSAVTGVRRSNAKVHTGLRSGPAPKTPRSTWTARVAWTWTWAWAWACQGWAEAWAWARAREGWASAWEGWKLAWEGWARAWEGWAWAWEGWTRAWEGWAWEGWAWACQGWEEAWARAW